jgi:hypothetical protein
MAMSEDRFQQNCYLWFHNKYPEHRGLLFHCPNGGNRNAREGAKFKAMGVWSGVADLLFIWNGILYCIELKTPTGTQRKEQREWATIVGNQGLEYYIVREQEVFEELIEHIIKHG